MASEAALWFSSVSANSAVVGAGSRGTVEGNSHRTRTHERFMVPASTTVNGQAIEVAMVRGCPLIGTRNSEELLGDRSTPLVLAAEWEFLERMGLSGHCAYNSGCMCSFYHSLLSIHVDNFSAMVPGVGCGSDFMPLKLHFVLPAVADGQEPGFQHD